MTELNYPASCRRRDVFEISLEGPSEGNPFTEQWLQGVFTSADESKIVRGFYDGNGIYRLRFMPSFGGNYTFVIRGSFLSAPLSGMTHVSSASSDNHGIVRVSDTYHFSYEDGTRYIPIGTTCYVWDLESDEQVKQTLDTLQHSPFNKVRFCIFPKHYAYNFKEPYSYPYEGKPVDSSKINEDNYMDYYANTDSQFDHTRFNPAHFQRIEYCIRELAERGIEADLILFHPYDRWGFSRMSAEEDELYLKYVLSRFSAFHNVWWSMANEWDLLKSKTETDWERLAGILVRNDPWHHLRSIHNCRRIYDQNRAWITHVSMQRIDLYKGAELTDQYRQQYGKPVVFDEMGYEGNLSYGWGNLTAEELTRRAWECAMRGGYPGHSETCFDDPSSIWWSHGGKLKGESWKRFVFLKKILEEVPGGCLSPYEDQWDSVAAVPAQEEYNPIKSEYLFYYSFMRPSSRSFDFHNDALYSVEVIDTWNMTIHNEGIFKGKFTVNLPGNMYMLIRMKLAGADEPADSHETNEEISEDIVDEGNDSDDEYALISKVSTDSSEKMEVDEDTPYTYRHALRQEERDKPEGDIQFSENDLDDTSDMPVVSDEEEDEAIERTLNIPPVDFSRSINEPPKKKNQNVKS